jgi:ribosomal protein S18 acetylase RimI-like enzyme
MQFIIRPFRIPDVDALAEIATLSFAEEYEARGQTSASFMQQIRRATRGRMIPFKIFSRLAGYKWAIFVAEVNGRIVGCGGYLGRKQMELANLMVHPDYRRRGIGQALLEKRLDHLTQAGFGHVTTTVLATNTASLGNLAKKGFEVFDQYTILEKPLLASSNRTQPNPDLLTRPLKASDRPVFRSIETALATPDLLELEGSRVDHYFPSLGAQLLNRLTGGRFWTRTFLHQEAAIGFLLGITGSSQRLGTVGRPMVSDNHLPHLPAMLHEAEAWLITEGKDKIRISIPTARPHLRHMLEEQGWAETYTWIRLVKQL